MTQSLEAGQILGEYEILKTIKAGGMGEVLLARKEGAFGFEKLVAIKTIRSDLREDEDLKKMFLDEARLLSRLEHPSITQVHDFGEHADSGLLYLVMEYVSGTSLSEILTRRQGALPVGVTTRYMDEVLRGLHAAHELKDLEGQAYGVVHRDISPQNLILTFEGRAKIIDFGIALMRDREAPVTSLGMPKGKPAYMSPEQINSDHIDRRTDIFAAGVVLHETLTGKRLFREANIAQTIQKVLTFEVPPPSTLNPQVPSALDDIVRKALARDKELRFASALELAQELNSISQEFPKETLENFAQEALATELAAHRKELQALLGTHTNSEEQPTKGRPLEQRTVQAKVDPVKEALELSASGAEPEVAPIQKLITNTRYMVERPFMRWLLPSVFILSLFTIILVSQKTHKNPPGTKVVMQNNMPVLVPAKPQKESQPKRYKKKPGAKLKNKKKIPRTPQKQMVKPETKPDIVASTPDALTKTKPQEVSATGQLTVGANPWATVKIDGKSMGNTPLLGIDVPIGTHTLELIAPDSRKVRYKTQIEIIEGKHLRIKAPD